MRTNTEITVVRNATEARFRTENFTLYDRERRTLSVASCSQKMAAVRLSDS